MPNTSPCPSSELVSPLFHRGIPSPFSLEKDLGFSRILPSQLLFLSLLEKVLDGKFNTSPSSSPSDWVNGIVIVYLFLYCLTRYYDAPMSIQWFIEFLRKFFSCLDLLEVSILSDRVSSIINYSFFIIAPIRTITARHSLSPASHIR